VDLKRPGGTLEDESNLICGVICSGKVAGLIWIRFAFSSLLGSTYLGGHDDFAIVHTRHMYYLALDVNFVRVQVS